MLILTSTSDRFASVCSTQSSHRSSLASRLVCAACPPRIASRCVRSKEQLPLSNWIPGSDSIAGPHWNSNLWVDSPNAHECPIRSSISPSETILNNNGPKFGHLNQPCDAFSFCKARNLPLCITLRDGTKIRTRRVCSCSAGTPLADPMLTFAGSLTSALRMDSSTLITVFSSSSTMFTRFWRFGLYSSEP